MLKKILLGIVVIVAVILIAAAFQPNEFKVERRATIAAAPAAVFPHVNEFKKWQAWSPWEKLDPQMKRTFGGPEGGVGATYAWVGNSDVGEGKMTITESRPNEKVQIKLDFIKPFESSSDTVFALAPDGKGTAVRWTMSGKNNYMSKLFCLFMNMDKMVGGDFEKGLAALKAVAEGGPKA